MNYKLENFEILTAEGQRISGQESANEYLKCSAVNPFNRFEPTHTVVIFDANTVAHYKNVLPRSRGGILPDEGWSENGLVREDKVLNNAMTYEYDLGGEYCRKYTADIVDASGNVVPGKKAGDFIRDANGRIKRFRKIDVFVQYDYKRETLFDDSGFPLIDEHTGMPKMRVLRDANGQPETYWVQNWSPSYVGERMRALLTPYTAEVAALDEAGATSTTPAPGNSESVFDDDDEAGEQQQEAQTAQQGAQTTQQQTQTA